MKKIFFSTLTIITLSLINFSSVFAQTGQTASGTKLPSSQNNVLGLSEADLRSGNVNMDTIPLVLSTIINTIIYLSGTISAFMLIYFAVKMQLASGITGDSSGVDSAKKGMIAAGVGFAISISAWFLMARIMEILVNVTQ